MLETAVEAMTSGKSLFDVTIICTTDDHQAEYWMERLSTSLCATEGSKFPMVLACSEDWGAGGAGNGLGTLYAYQKACALAKTKHDVDLAKLLDNQEISAALFHTAGKGTRMAPLPASENNNKPGVVSTCPVAAKSALFFLKMYCQSLCLLIAASSLSKTEHRFFCSHYGVGGGGPTNGGLCGLSQGSVVCLLGRPNLYPLGSL